MIFRIRMTLALTLALLASVGAQTRGGSSGGVVTGRVQTRDGSPAAGIRVAAIASGDLMAFTLTDNAGRYRIDDIPPGRYLIAAGLIGSFTYLPGTADETKATTVSVVAGSTTANLDFELAVAAGVRLRGVAGIPAGNFPRARLATLNGRTLSPSEAIDPVDSAVQEDGSFEFRGIMPGNYTIEFLPTGQQIALTVGSANIDNIKVKAPSVVTGRVLVEDGGPLLTSPSQVNAASTFLRIATIPPDGSGNNYHPVAGNGTFGFTLPADATYGVEVYDLPFGYYVKSIRSGGLAAKSIRLSDGTRPHQLDVVLTKQRPAAEPPGVAVRGRVSSSNPALPAGLQVALTMTPPFYHSGVRVEGDGSFSFHDVPEGNYSAALVSGGFTMSVPVIVGTTNIDNLELSVPGQVSLKGRVLLENGSNPTALPTFSMRFSRSTGQFFIATAKEGTFSVNLLEGDYRITFTSLPERYTLQSVNPRSKDPRFDMTINASKPEEELVITLRGNGNGNGGTEAEF